MSPSSTTNLPDSDAIITATEAQTVRTYDRQRRQRLLLLLGSTFGGAIGILFVVVLLLLPTVGSFGSTQLVEVVGVGLNGVIYLGVVIFARRGRVEIASALFAIGAGIVPNLNVFASAATGGASPFNVVFLMGAIVIVGLAGRPWMVLGTALLSSLTTVYMVQFAPLSSTTPAQEGLRVYLQSVSSSIIPVLFIAYWGMTFLLLAQWRSYQRLLLELANVRVQNERARQLDELKDQFIRSVNHELRTPIMTLLGYIDLLMSPDNRQSADKVERYVQRASRAGQSLRRLLAGILDTRRLNTSQQTFVAERLDVLTVLEEVIPLLPAEIQNEMEVERALRVRLTPGLSIWAEALQFQQVLLNLLSNAVKYSDPGTPVDISVQTVNIEPRKWSLRFRAPAAPTPMVELTVRDYGLGIPPEQQPLLFQRFMRLPRELESQVMGTGLGLYLCKTMVEQMGGTIAVESSGIAGEGSTFRVRLPLPPGDSEEAASPPPSISVERHTGPLSSDLLDAQKV